MIRDYRYGCLPPTEGAAIVDEQMRLGHRYRNVLTEIELSRRALIPPRCPCAVASANGRCACAACDEAATGSSTSQHCGATDAAWAFVRGLAIGHANASAAEVVRRARNACGVYWGSYLLVEAANDAQRRCPDPPRFRRWNGSGRIGVQLQRGLSVPDLLACTDPRLRLEPIADDGRARSCRHDPARGIGRTRVWVRVGSDGRAPVWGVFPVVIHRPVPSDGVIKWAIITRVIVGTTSRYELHLTVEAGAQANDARPPRPARSGSVAVDLGWRRCDDGLRAAYWADDSGAHGEVRLPVAMERKIAHARSLLSIRERAFAHERHRHDLAADRGALPDWLADAACTMTRWRSADRLYALYWRWRRERFDGDAAMFVGFATWAKQDRHLHGWADHEVDNVIARRRDIVRVFAAGLARKYARVIVEDLDVRDLIAKRKESEIAKNASPNRHLVAPGMLRLAIKQACARHGAEYVEIEAAYTTQRCAACGHVEPFDAAAQVDRRPPCSACGDASDQDWNAARNLLASGKMLLNGRDPLAGGKENGNGKMKRSGRFRRRTSDVTTEGCSQPPAQDGASHVEST